MTNKSKLLAAAIAGIVGATFVTSPLLAKGRTKDSSSADKKMEKNSCKGKNGCNGSGSCKGMNSCKGKGGCKTDKHACKGMNECKGQGGCKS